MKNTNNTTKRTLDEIIDVDQYIVSKGTRRVYKKKLVLKENWDMRLNSTFVKSTSERHFAVAFKKDFHEAVVVPNCEPQIQFSKNGVAKDIELVKKFGRKNKLFPLVYILDWDEKNELWIGKLDQKTKEWREFFLQERKQKIRIKRRKYYENNRYEFSKHRIENMQKEINRLNKEIPEKIHEYYKIYAYGVNMENYTISILRHYGIAKEKSFYQECVSNTYLGYMYSIGRCAYCGYTGKHAENYIKLMIRVGIICGINTSNEARQIGKEIHAKVVYLDDN